MNQSSSEEGGRVWREGVEGVEQVCCGRAEASGGGGEECPGECSSLNPGDHGNQQECSGSV